MISPPGPSRWRVEYPSASYAAPFIFFLICLFVFPGLPLSPAWGSAVWVALAGAACLACFPRDISLRPRFLVLSTLIGIAVFGLWIAPEALIPGYRHGALFSNAILGRVPPAVPTDLFRNPAFLFWRTVRAVVIVPVVEELFWRGWLMRWLISSDFQKIPLGTYRPMSFWITAILFASEHGPYWEVGLLAGVIYNAWMVRSKSLADCIWMHAVTNGALCAYVILGHHWQYWQ
ncbi:MAG TPA: CAAX prenyl protease-related protein [Bryobacteraceae bacterium]|nr:CAAX prenyl protease-related protein [Bryobacteraceae bacterium]